MKNSTIKPNKNQIRFARHLEKEHGKLIAINYLKLVTKQDYLSYQNIDKAHHAVNVALGHQQRLKNALSLELLDKAHPVA